jgi:K+-sensing histidine kinase KdpD
MYFLVVKSSTIHRNTFKRTLAEMEALRTKSHLEHEQFVERSMLIDMLTHELKTPLATLRMAAGSLKYVFSQPENFDQTSAQERLGSISESISSMDAVLERCIQVDQLDQKKFSIRPEFVDMESLILDLPIVHLNRSRLNLSIPDNLVIEVDPQLFSMITTNLIDNALKYSHRSSSIDLNIYLDDGVSPELARNYIVMTVDNHIGVSGAPDSSQLFTRYYRSSYAHNISGTGLGLYLIRSICSLLSGSIQYQPHENLVRFVVRLPA